MNQDNTEELKEKNLEQNLQFHIDNLTNDGISAPRRFTAEELIPQTMMRKAKKVRNIPKFTLEFNLQTVNLFQINFFRAI